MGWQALRISPRMDHTVRKLSAEPGARLSGWRRLLAASLLASLVMRPIDAQAWGADGHRLIAEIAEGKLSGRARVEIERLLSLEPGATLASVSTWADEFRSPSTAPWHYVNLPRDGNCRYESDRSCAQGACVVGAIERQTAVLSSSAPDLERLKALKYVVHLVADAHQPLHAGFADDRGGNTVQVQAFGRGTNLHALWDTGLIREWPGGAESLRAAVEAERAAVDASLSPGSWVEESCRVVQAGGFYPDSHKLDDEYAQRWAKVLTRQLAAAASRLAAVLNQGLDRR
jgi:hypothetical protein